MGAGAASDTDPEAARQNGDGEGHIDSVVALSARRFDLWGGCLFHDIEKLNAKALGRYSVAAGYDRNVEQPPNQFRSDVLFDKARSLLASDFPVCASLR